MVISPIEQLTPAIQGIAYAIAPENTTELTIIRDQFNFSFQITDDVGFQIRVDLTTATIFLPIRALDYLWTCALTYWVFTQEYAASQRRGEIQFDPLGNQRLRHASDVLSWSKINLECLNYQPWPENLPKPKSPSENQSDTHVANELFLCALGWIVHHEIAHVVLKHPYISSLPLLEEKEADRYAADWILKSLRHDDPRLRKRGLGMATALLCLESIEVGTNRNFSRTHPPAYQRLADCLSPYKFDAEESIQAFSAIVLQFLYAAQGINANINGNSFEEILNDFMFDISQA